MFGEILAGVGSVLGLFKKNKPQETSSHVDYQRMVRDATAAGFNPLTALRNGGSAGFTSTTTTPAMASTDFISRASDAFSTLGNMFATIDPNANKREDLELQLVEAQLQNLQADTEGKVKSNRLIGQTPSWQGPGQFSMLSGALNGKPGKAKASPDDVTNPFPLGADGKPVMRVNPAFKDANEASTRWGEPGEWVAGALTMGADLATNLQDWETSFIKRHGVDVPKKLGDTKKSIQKRIEDERNAVSDPLRRPAFNSWSW